MAHPLYGTKMDVLYDNKLDRFNLRHANPPRHGIYQCQEETCSEFGRTFSARKHFCMHKHRAEKCMTPLCPYYGSTFTPNCSFKVHLKQVRHIAAVEYQRKAEAAGKILPRMTSSDWNRKMLEDFGKSELVPAAMEEIDDSLLPKNDDLDIADTELFGPLDKAERLAQLNRNWKLVNENLHLPWAELPIAACPGPGDGQACLWNVDARMVDNTDVNVRGGMISLLARCVQCQKINNSQYHLTYLPLRKERRDAEGRVLCSASLVCPEPRERTTLRCVEHNETHRQAKLESFRREAFERVRTGQGMKVVDAPTMASLLVSPNTIMPSNVIPQKLAQMPLAKGIADMDINVAPAISRPQKLLKRDAEGAIRHLVPTTSTTSEASIFVCDLEFSYCRAGITHIHSIAIINLTTSQLVVNARLKHTVDLTVVERDCALTEHSMAMLTFRRFWGGYCALPIITARELHDTLRSAGFGPQSIFMDWSANYVDYRLLSDYLSHFSFSSMMPPENNRFSALNMWRRFLPGLFCHRLGEVFRLLHPEDDIVKKAHNAAEDAKMAGMLFADLVEFWESQKARSIF